MHFQEDLSKIFDDDVITNLIDPLKNLIMIFSYGKIQYDIFKITNQIQPIKMKFIHT